MLSYKLFEISNLGQADYKNQDTPNVSVVDFNTHYIQLKKLIHKTKTYTTCNFHFFNEHFVPIQLKDEALPFSYPEHIWNTTAILNWENKGILQRLSIPFSIFNVTDIYPEVVDTVTEFKILEHQQVKLFYVKDLQFKTTIRYDENNSYDITFKEIDGNYRPYLISDLPKDLWLYVMDKHGDDVEVIGDIEIKYLKSNSYYLEYTITDNDSKIKEDYYPGCNNERLVF